MVEHEEIIFAKIIGYFKLLAEQIIYHIEAMK